METVCFLGKIEELAYNKFTVRTGKNTAAEISEITLFLPGVYSGRSCAIRLNALKLLYEEMGFVFPSDILQSEGKKMGEK